MPETGIAREAYPVVVTGPTGWIGSAMLATLAARLGPGWNQRVRLFGSSARAVTAPDGTRLEMRPLDTIEPQDVDGAAVIHLAYLTKEKVDLLGERTFIDTNLAIDDQVLKALTEARPRAVFVASSGAAALAERGADRHPYGLAKLRQEDRFLAYAARADVPMLAGRIFNIAGPWINKLESYAVSSFLSQGMRTGRIRIEATVPVYRSYLHVGDLAELVLAALDQRLNWPDRADLCGTETVEMADVAAAAAAALGLDAERIDRDRIDFTRTSRYLGDPSFARTLALRIGHPLRPFAAQVADTARYLTKF